MRLSWWLVPVAAVLLLGGMAGGIWIARGQPGTRLADNRGVSVPQLPGTQVQPRQTAPPPAPAQPSGESRPTGGDKPSDSAPQPKRPADSEAIAFVSGFMQARMAGDAAKAGGMLAPEVPKGGLRVSQGDARITAYTADLLGSGDMDAFIFRLNVAWDSGQPGAEVSAEAVRVTWKGGFKVVSLEEVAPESLALGVGKDGSLYLHRRQDMATAAALSALPAQFGPHGAAPGTAFGVGKDGWAVAAPSLSGSHVLWATRGNHPLVGVSAIKWQGTPAVTPLDLLIEGGAVDAAWAPGGARHVALTVVEPSGATSLYIWDLAAMARYGPDLTAHFGDTDYAVRRIRWTGASVVAFDVQRAGKITGPWTYNANSKALTPP